MKRKAKQAREPEIGTGLELCVISNLDCNLQ